MNYSFSKALTAFFFASASVILAGTALAAESVDDGSSYVRSAKAAEEWKNAAEKAELKMMLFQSSVGRRAEYCGNSLRVINEKKCWILGCCERETIRHNLRGKHPLDFQHLLP
jgi:hypothetical protein